MIAGDDPNDRLLCAHRTVVDALSAHVIDRPDRLSVGIVDGAALTFRELDDKARALARHLLAQGFAGPILVPIRSDLSSIIALIACFHGRLPAVPVPMPARNGTTERLRITAAASQCVAAIVPDAAETIAAQLPGLALIPFDAQADADIRLTAPEPTDVAIIQYTSGSTTAPRGAILTHANLTANLEMLRIAFGIGEDDRFGSWLPMFHDMGLAMLLMPLYFGVPGYFMPPLGFVRSPLRWLSAVGRYGITITGAPNSAYAACVTRIAPTHDASLDLRSLRLAFCGAEPVRLETMTRFAGSGFDPAALYPCYGLAEATCFVAGGHLDASRCTDDAASTVPCGAPARGSTIAIVDPEALARCPDGTVGEIWVSGPHVAAGYQDEAAATQATFAATLPECPGLPFLRTGDLGFRLDGALTIIGRCKDVIIHRGANLHAADIEAAVARSHPGFGQHGAAFAWLVDGVENVVVVHEVAHAWVGVASDALKHAAIDAVVFHHGVRLFDLVAVRPGTVPRTSSGKVRRGPCRDLYRSLLQPTAREVP